MLATVPLDGRRAQLGAAQIPDELVEIKVEDGVATLVGWVPTELDASRAAEGALLAGGVRVVENRLVSDERLFWHARAVLRRLGLESDVDVSAKDGTLRLSGAVPGPGAHARVIEAIRGIPGLRALADDLDVGQTERQLERAA